MVAPTQDAYEKEASVKENLNLETLRCAESALSCTGLQTTASSAAPYSAAMQWKFAYNRYDLSPGTMVAPTQDACEREALGKESLEIEILRW